MESTFFDQKILESSSEILRAVAHRLRLSILQFIDKKTEVNVNEIYTTLKLEQSITSQHLRILRDANVVNTRRDGKMIFYSVNHELLARIATVSQQIEQLTRDKSKAKKKD